MNCIPSLHWRSFSKESYFQHFVTTPSAKRQMEDGWVCDTTIYMQELQEHDLAEDLALTGFNSHVHNHIF
jgi:hypothetical protein